MGKDYSDRAPSTICSAVIYRGNKIAIKEVEGEGLSLLGGHVKWEYGLPECVKQRVFAENRILFEPHSINGITHHRTPSSKDVINVNVAGHVTDASQQQNVYWMTLDEALRRADEFRTPDIKRLLIRTERQDSVSLDFIQPTMLRRRVDYTETVPGSEATQTERRDLYGPTDFVVISAAIRSKQEGQPARYLFMECGRKQFAGKLSLLGGKLNRDERLVDALGREIPEESDGTLKFSLLGLVGLYISDVGSFSNQPANYASNFAAIAIAENEDVKLSEKVLEEVRCLKWLSIDEIAEIPNSEFRTIDTKSVVMRAENLVLDKRVLPFDFVERVD